MSADVVSLYARFGVGLRVTSATQAFVSVRCFTGRHDDRHASARVNLATGGYDCFACGASGGVLTALELLGVRDHDERLQLAREYGVFQTPARRSASQPKLTPRASTPPAVPSVERVDWDGGLRAPAVVRERAYDYSDAAGQPVGRVKRVDLADGQKRIWQERPEGSGWVAGLQGKLLPLYRLPAVLAAAARGERILIVEGEKACAALDRVGLFATTCAGGAGKWRDELTPSLRGASVLALVDSDLPGRLHGAEVTAAVLAEGIAAQTPLDLYELRDDGSDVVDYLAAVAQTTRAVLPDIDEAELRQRLGAGLRRQLNACLPADGRALQLFTERARFRHDSNSRVLLDCERCGLERPHRVSHGLAFCNCGAHRLEGMPLASAC